MAGGRQGAPDFDPRRLRDARDAAQLTRDALARAAHVHVNSIFEWEAGRQVPTVETVAALADALSVSPLDLLEPGQGVALTLHQLRAGAGKSQQQVAADAGMLRTTYSRIERGETATLAEDVPAALARALGVTEEQVLAACAASRTAYLQAHPRTTGRGRRVHINDA